MANDEFFDEELQSIVNYVDETGGQCNSGPNKRTTWFRMSTRKKKALKRCVQWVLIYGSLSALMLYWRQTGQMHSSAALPSIYVCALLIGVHLGRFQGER